MEIWVIDHENKKLCRFTCVSLSIKNDERSIREAAAIDDQLNTAQVTPQRPQNPPPPRPTLCSINSSAGRFSALGKLHQCQIHSSVSG